MNLGGPSGISMSSGPNGSHMSMRGPNGINISSGPGGNSSLVNVPGGRGADMIGWNDNFNNGNTGVGNGLDSFNDWPGQIGWNNNAGNNINNGLVNGRYPNGSKRLMIGWNKVNNVNINSPINGNIHSSAYASDYDYGMGMTNAVSGMGNININNGGPWGMGYPGYPGTTKKDRKKDWWRKR